MYCFSTTFASLPTDFMSVQCFYSCSANALLSVLLRSYFHKLLGWLDISWPKESKPKILDDLSFIICKINSDWLQYIPKKCGLYYFCIVLYLYSSQSFVHTRVIDFSVAWISMYAICVVCHYRNLSSYWISHLLKYKSFVNLMTLCLSWFTLSIMWGIVEFIPRMNNLQCNLFSAFTKYPKTLLYDPLNQMFYIAMFIVYIVFKKFSSLIIFNVRNR